MFSQDPLLGREAFENRFYDDFELDFGGVLGARSAHILLFGRPGGQHMPDFGKSVSELDFLCAK